MVTGGDIFLVFLVCVMFAVLTLIAFVVGFNYGIKVKPKASKPAKEETGYIDYKLPSIDKYKAYIPGKDDTESDEFLHHIRS